MKQKQKQKIVEEVHDVETNEENGNNDSTTNGQDETTAVDQLNFTEEERAKGILKNFKISKKTIKKLKARGVEFLFPVQSESYNFIHEKKNCIVKARTGTGKTLAFILPIVELLQSQDSDQLEDGRSPRVLVLTPTRELTKQISDDFSSIVTNLSVVTIGGKKNDQQEAGLRAGCDIIVAAPARLSDFISNGKISLENIQHVVLDEIDQMLDMGFKDSVNEILSNVFSSDTTEKPQMIVFSATIPDWIKQAKKQYMSSGYEMIDLIKDSKQKTATNVEQMSTDQDRESTIDVQLVKAIDGVTEEAKAHVRSTAEHILEKRDAIDALSAALACVSGTTSGGTKSLLTNRENYTTYMMTVQDEFQGVGLVYTTLRRCFGDDFDAKSNCSKIGFTKDRKGAVFDLPSELDETLQGYWKDSPRLQLKAITELPEIDEASMNGGGNDYNARGGGRGGQRGGSRGNSRGNGRGGSFDRPSNACFNCGQTGHMSRECTEPKSGGGGGQSNACYNCGQTGHMSRDCTEPKTGGGRPSNGSSNVCYNCNQEGHMSRDCTEPRKAGGRPSGGDQSNVCFNCQQPGHMSRDCTEPRKFGGSRGGRGGGGRGGGGRGGGPKRSFDLSGDGGGASNKKVKFDSDGEDE